MGIRWGWGEEVRTESGDSADADDSAGHRHAEGLYQVLEDHGEQSGHVGARRGDEVDSITGPFSTRFSPAAATPRTMWIWWRWGKRGDMRGSVFCSSTTAACACRTTRIVCPFWTSCFTSIWRTWGKRGTVRSSSGEWSPSRRPRR